MFGVRQQLVLARYWLEHMLSMPFIDDFHTGADAFSFFYIVRPCVATNRSIYGKRLVCSYAFQRSQNIKDYVNPVQIENFDLAHKLASQASKSGVSYDADGEHYTGQSLLSAEM